MDIEEVRGVGDLFSLLRLIFMAEPSKELLEQLLKIETTEPENDIDRGLELMRRDVQKNRNQLDEYLEELAVEFARLFLGPQNPVAIPFASFYLSETRQLMTEVTIEVRRQYLEAGMAVKNLYQIPDDHLAIELEFAAWLADETAKNLKKGDTGMASESGARLESFLQEHLAKWLPLFADRLSAGTKSDFYQGAAMALKGMTTMYAQA
ncbi:MAG: hypothetical protein A2505_05190 [Deltaproteobacteria bacterium RIFOXYD12_FULL_55_16]|nr:MAG: hypothetical protein A2505_05190 [Deltaproteobacteria bacterium RIFOXYD12_FULL_55_16]